MSCDVPTVHNKSPIWHSVATCNIFRNDMGLLNCKLIISKYTEDATTFIIYLYLQNVWWITLITIKISKQLYKRLNF